MSNQTAKQRAGAAAEDIACRYLLDRGLRLVARNFTCKLGEIDLIMRERDTLVFVEVRHRSQKHFGGGLESVTPAKQRRIIRAAQLYLLRHPEWSKAPCRIDVIATGPGESFGIQWIPNAFHT